jgi:hypothetical protein
MDMTTLQRNRFQVRLYQWLLRLANAIAALPNRVTPPPFRLLQMGSAFWLSRAVYVAARLELADALGEAQKTVAALAVERGLHEGHLYRLLRMLAANGVFRETAPRTFVNSPLSHYLREEHPHSLRAMILMHNSPLMTAPWLEPLEQSMRTGETPFAQAHGAELFDYMERDVAFDHLFARAMDAVEALTGSDYLQDFDWSRFDRVIDVGGSQGAKALALLKTQAHMRALVFDRPPVIVAAHEAWQGKVDPAVLARVEFAGGDMLEQIPPPQSERDIYLFMAVFHGMDDATVRCVLQNLRRTIDGLRPGIVVVETVLPPVGTDPALAGFDMQMLIGTRGRERTLAEWTTLFDSAGFALREVVAVRTFARFMVVQPA